MDQTSHANKANDSETYTDTPASYALATYHHQPEPLETVLPSSAGSATFFPVPPPSSHGGADASLFAATIHQPPLLNPHDIAFLHLQQQQQHVPSASVPPPSTGAATFVLPAQPASQQRSAAAYPPVVTAPPPLSNPHEMAFHQQQQQLQAFWAGQLAEAEQATELKVHSLPLARIKKIMKADEDVKMIAAEAPVVFAKACEMFILELTLRAWLHTQGTKRRTLQRSDVDAVINATETYDFLLDDVAPEDERKGNGGGAVVAPPPPPPPMTATTAVPVQVPSSYASGPTTSSAPFAMYANMQPVAYMWPQPEHQHHQDYSEGGGATEQG